MNSKETYPGAKDLFYSNFAHREGMCSLEKPLERI